MLTRFVDTYALETEVDNYLISSVQWQEFDSTEKERWIKAISQKLDNLMYGGQVKVDGQPMKFPREFNSYYYASQDNVFDESEQVRVLIRAVSYQVEFDLNRNGIGFVNQSIGDESVTERQEVICRETLQVLRSYFVKSYGGAW